jgi:phospholipase A1
MTPSPHTIALLSLGLAATTPALAQSPEDAPEHASVNACALVEIDADRLACYDRVAGRRTLDPAQADAAAALARQNREAASEAEAAAATPVGRARGAANDLFASEPDDAIANAGKGSLLDSRWELAKDS